MGVVALHPLRHLKELHLDDNRRDEPDVEWPMRWSTLTSVTALTCRVQSKLPELTGVMTNLRSLEIEYADTENNSQQDRLRIQNLTRLTSLKILEGNYV